MLVLRLVLVLLLVLVPLLVWAVSYVMMSCTIQGRYACSESWWQQLPCRQMGGWRGVWRNCLRLCLREPCIPWLQYSQGQLLFFARGHTLCAGASMGIGPSQQTVDQQRTSFPLLLSWYPSLKRASNLGSEVLVSAFPR